MAGQLGRAAGAVLPPHALLPMAVLQHVCVFARQPPCLVRTWKVTTPRGSRRAFSFSPATPSFLRMSSISWDGMSGCEALSSANASLQGKHRGVLE